MILNKQSEKVLRRRDYPATLPKVAWHALEYSPASFKVLDVARRVGSGIGSFGVDRFYVLLAGEERPAAADDDAYDVPSDDRAAEEDKHSRRAVILDVKEEPSPAARDAFEATSGKTGDAAWFDHLFKNQAARAVKAQRAITSLTDPYAGWAKIDERDFVVRERSPYKASLIWTNWTRTRTLRNTWNRSPRPRPRLMCASVGKGRLQGSDRRRSWDVVRAHDLGR